MAQGNLIVKNLQLRLELFTSKTLGQRRRLNFRNRWVIIQFNGSLQAVATYARTPQKCSNACSLPPQFCIRGIAIKRRIEVVESFPGILLYFRLVKDRLICRPLLARPLFDAINNKLSMIFVGQI